MYIPTYLYTIFHEGKHLLFTMGDLNKYRPLVDKIIKETGQDIVPLRLIRQGKDTAAYMSDDGAKVATVNI